MSQLTFSQAAALSVESLLAIIASGQLPGDIALADADDPSDWPVDIVADDNADLTAADFRSIYVGTGGDVFVIGVGDTSNNGAGTPARFVVPHGGIIPVRPRCVLETTTASDLVGLK